MRSTYAVHYQIFGGSQGKPLAHMAEQQRTSEDAQQGIPAIPDPAALDQDQYGKLAQGASVGAGSGAAFGEHGCRNHPGTLADATMPATNITHCLTAGAAVAGKAVSVTDSSQG